jgi:hypothetical protein
VHIDFGGAQNWVVSLEVKNNLGQRGLPMNDEELIDEMVQRLGKELKGLLSQVQAGRVPAATVELAMREQLWHVGAQAMGVILEALDKQLASNRPAYDHRTRTVVSLFGPLDVTRARCWNGTGWSYPLDEAMGLMGHRGWSVGVQEAVSLLSCESGFATTSDLMGRLLGVSISPSIVQQLAESVGKQAHEMLEVQTHDRGDGQVSALAPHQDCVPDTLIIATDGCQAPQRDGWHEVKVATLYPKASRCKSSSGRSKLLSKGYFATLENAEQFGWALRAVGKAWGTHRVRRVVCMGDGAPWIWNLTDLHFPGAIEIVDFYHAAEHLWEVGEALWGDRHTSVATRAWVRRYRKYLKQGRTDLVIGAIERGWLQRQGKLSAKQGKTVRLNLAYFQRNRFRMRYGRFRQMKLPISTGAVEGACKFVVQSRFKRPGSRWSREGLSSMLALKLMRLNDRWELLWPYLDAA